MTPPGGPLDPDPFGSAPRLRVLVARLDNLGDVVLAGPAVHAVAASASVVLLAGRRGRAAARLLPGVDRLLEFTAPWIDPEPAPVDSVAVAALIAEVRAAAVDQAVILTSFHQSPLPLALVLRMAGVPVVAAASDDYPGSLLDVRHRATGDEHEVERSLDLVARLGFRLPPGDDGRLRVRRPAAGTPLPFPAGSYVVVHPGASVPARAWAPARAADAVAALRHHGVPVAVTGDPAETALTAFVAGPPHEGAPAVDLGGRTTLAELVEVLAGAAVVVCGNTGAAHLSAAVGTPVVSLYAPTVPVQRWRPWAVPHVVLGDQAIACAGCRSRVCPVPGHPCLGEVSASDVVDAVERLRSTRSGTPGPTRAGEPVGTGRGRP